MSKELIERLREKADSLTTTVGVMNLLHEAADALESKYAELRAGQEPVAYITGYHGGRCIIEPVNRAAVLPSGMALYSTPQPSAVPDSLLIVDVDADSRSTTEHVITEEHVRSLWKQIAELRDMLSGEVETNIRLRQQAFDLTEQRDKQAGLLRELHAVQCLTGGYEETALALSIDAALAEVRP